MSTKTKNETVAKQSLFSKENYLIMLVGMVFLALGFFLMAGGKSADPKNFDPKEVYSTTRITIAPILIIIGFIIEIVAIMKKSKN
jgi:cytochrome bd-type quinol oxidase subunit 2